ncbi:MAG: hydantoinase/oxoprolinase N-terminal domain-containing protein [Desulfobacterales bacterium]|jgi:N-methylhydantoinase A/oxoprolinase/acetone carboxylase beta subunit
MKTRSIDKVYGIGIDTGGTYTDAVLLDLREHQVITASKRPTIHHCLELSILQALEDIYPVDESDAVRQIAFSKTLATNAIAEGRMSRVGLIVIGRVKPFDAPVISNNGSLIDRWQTHIDAVDIHTVGIGGDSIVRLNRVGQLTIGPLRVKPLAMVQGDSRSGQLDWSRKSQPIDYERQFKGTRPN